MTGYRRGRPLVARIAAAAVLMLLALAPLAPEAGGAKGGKVPAGEFRLLEPISKSLGASSWLMTQRYDPRFWNVPGVSGRTNADMAAYGAVPQGSVRSGGAFAPAVPFRSAAPAFSRNLIVTRQLGLFPLQTEPHMAANPEDPEHLVLGVIDYNFPSMSTYTSFDGGETWDGPNQVRYFREDLTAAGDPVIGFDRDGNVYVVFISLGVKDYQLGALASSSEISSIGIARSTDDGLSWEDAVSTARSRIETTSDVDASGRERGEIAIDFLDKPWITIGPNPKDPSKDNIYVVYTEFKTRYTAIYADEVPFLTSPLTETTIKMVRSEDQGATWSDPVPVSPTVFQAENFSEGEGEGLSASGVFEAQAEAEDPGLDSNQTVQGPQPAVLPDGTVVVAYLDTTLDGVQNGLYTIQVAKSADGGRTFEQPTQAGVLREIKFRPRNSSFRWWGAAFPQLTAGPNGELYILTTAGPPDRPTDDGDIYLLRSLDGGTTWEAPQRLNQDDTDRIQFFPAIDVAPNGVVHAMWADMRDDPDEVRYHIYYSRSQDQGATWGFSNPDLGIDTPDTRVTDFASNSLRGFPGGRFLGDYFALSATDEDVYMVWADTRLGEYGGPNQQIGFARQTAMEPPSIFLNPPSGDAGRDVDIQGFGFQPDSDIAIDVGGITITNLRSNAKGEFQTSVYMPVTGEGPRDVTAFDETGNVATASFYTEFGFDTIARQLEELNRQAAEDTLAPAATPVSETP